ncbi:hypothetical protein GCM10010443_86950 [Actinoplanes cyaneus]|uniref:peptidoglycan-binding protein n=1 Tax=Actinoplanes cyaneus TaxID=52696 RepID=UPI0031E3BB53
MARRALRRSGHIITGLAALIGLIGIVAGAPAALLLLGGNPLPEHLPSLTQIAELLVSPDDGSAFLTAITVLGWAAWAWFTLPVLIEVVARLRGIRTPKLPAFGTPQKIAAGLVSAIGLLVASPAVAASAPAYAAPVVTTHTPAATVLAADTHQAPPAAAAPRPAVASPIVYTVARNDQLSAIAERFLGDADRYPELAHANPGLERRDHRFPDHIECGWRITMPAGAHDRGARDHAHGTASHPHRQDEKRATNSTGTPNAQTPPTSSTTGSAGPATGPGATVPSPPAPSRPAAAASTAPPATASTAPPAAVPSATTTPAKTASSAPAERPAPAGPSRAGTASPPTSAPQQPASADQAAAAPASDTDDDAGQVVTTGTLAGAGILTALLLGALYRRRRIQRQHRRPGRRLPHPARGGTEQVMRAAEQPADVDRLDAALRNLAAGLTGRAAHELPDIAGAWITTGRGTANQPPAPVISLILTRPCPNPPAPWTADGTAWTLPADAELAEPGDHLTPLPALVTIGSQPGQHLLLDLERLGQVSIVGSSDNTAALLRYLIVELACNRWSDDAEIAIAGFGQDEAELLAALNPDRIQATAALTAATSRLRRRCTAVTAALHAAGVGDTLTGRLTDSGEAWAPQILLAADPADTDRTELDELGRQLHDAGRCSVATVVATTTLGTTPGGGHTLALLDNGVLQITLADNGGAPYLAATVRAAALPRTELEPLAEIMTQARLAADEPVPAAPEPEPWAQGTDAAGSLLPHHLFAADPQPQKSEPDLAAPVQEQQAQAQQSVPDVQEVQPSASTADPITAVVPISDLPPARRETPVVPRQRHQLTDPDLDADLQAWHEQDPSRPLISILGPVTVTAPGTEPDRRRFYAEIVVLLAGRGARGITGDQISEALWPDQQISPSSRRVAIARVRRWLGEAPSGQLWLPDMGSDRVYRLTPGYLLDWHLFRRARARGESQGPAGITYLRAALELVHGVPFDGADRAYAVGARNPYAWLPSSDLYPGHIVSAVVDTAHRLAQIYLDTADYTNARWAIQQAWAADPDRGDDGPWQDLMRVEHAEGNMAELRNLVGELMRARDAEYPEDLAPSTYTWLRTLVPDLLNTGTFAG